MTDRPDPDSLIGRYRTARKVFTRRASIRWALRKDHTEMRIADAVATEFCRIRALAVEVGAVYPNPGADRGPLREALKRPPYLPFADLLDGAS